MRALQTSREVFFVQLLKHFFEIEVAALRTVGGEAHAAAAHAADAAARAIGASVVQVRRDQRTRSFAAIDAGEKQRGGAFENRKWSALKKVREAHVYNVFAAADGEDKAGVGIKLDAEARRTAIAAEAREDALKQRSASGNR